MRSHEERFAEAKRRIAARQRERRLRRSRIAGISAAAIIPCLYYPFVLCVVACFSIIFRLPKRYS